MTPKPTATPIADPREGHRLAAMWPSEAQLKPVAKPSGVQLVRLLQPPVDVPAVVSGHRVIADIAEKVQAEVLASVERWCVEDIKAGIPVDSHRMLRCAHVDTRMDGALLTVTVTRRRDLESW